MADELIETPPADAPPIEEAPPEFTLPEDFATTVQGWDIPLEDLSTAAQQYKSLQTEEGVIDAFIATGQSLGFGLKDLNRLFQEDAPVAPAAPAAPAAPVEQLDPERLLTAAEVDERFAQLRQEQQSFVESQQQAQVQAQQQQVQTQIEGWFDGQDVKDEGDRTLIAQYGAKHILPTQNPYDIRVVTAALERGKAEFDARVEAQAQAYLQRKAAKSAAQPTPVGGAPAGTTGNDEGAFDYAAAKGGAFDAARQRVRDRLRAAGELG